MNRQILTMLPLAVLVMALAAPSVRADDATPGEKAPAFTLTDIQGQSHSLSDFEGKTVVLEWTNYLCPFVVKHYGSGNMQKLQKQYTDKDVVWLTINSSAAGKQGHFSQDEWQRRSKEQKSASTAILLDPDGTVGQAYGAKTTPHMYVINKDGVLVYKGAIDDKPTFRQNDIKSSNNYVVAVLDSLLKGEEVKPEENRPYGCSVKY